MSTPPATLLPAVLRFAPMVSVAVSFLGIGVLIGWAVDLEEMKSVLPGEVSMKPNTALMLLLLGGAQWASMTGRLTRWLLPAVSLVFLIAAGTIAEYVTSVNLGIDQLLFTDDSTTSTADPGRPSPNTAFAFLCLSVAVAVRSRRGDRATAWLPLIPLTIGLLAVFGYVSGLQHLAGVSGVTKVAIHTALGLSALAAVECISAQHSSFAALFNSPRTGGRIFRVSITLVVLVPPLVAGAAGLAERKGWIPADSGVWILMAVMAPISIATAWVFGLNVDSAERERDQVTAELRVLSVTDPLTGLLNRRGFERELDRQIQLSTRYERPWGLLLLDLDCFKLVNDAGGHPAGDRFLVGVAWSLRAALRESDSIARIGGDEFAVLLPVADRKSIEHVSAKVLEAIRSGQDPAPAGRPAVTASIGALLVTVPTSTRSALAAVDAALYEAKSAGRDTWRVREEKRSDARSLPGHAMNTE